MKRHLATITVDHGEGLSDEERAKILDFLRIAMVNVELGNKPFAGQECVTTGKQTYECYSKEVPHADRTD